jgi:hypothetical protein
MGEKLALSGGLEEKALPGSTDVPRSDRQSVQRALLNFTGPTATDSASVTTGNCSTGDGDSRMVRPVPFTPFPLSP